MCQKCQPNQQQRVYKPRGIKETAAQWVQVKSFNVCPLQLCITIEYIRRHVCRKSFIVTAYQHDDDEFVSKCNIKIN